MLTANLIGAQSEYREAVPAVKYRSKLVERYGEEKGNATLFAEVFAVCEYDESMTEEESRTLLPF